MFVGCEKKKLYELFFNFILEGIVLKSKNNFKQPSIVCVVSKVAFKVGGGVGGRISLLYRKPNQF